MKALIKNIFILIIFLSISSCHEKDYDVMDEAKKFIFKDQKTKEDNNANLQNKKPRVSNKIEEHEEPTKLNEEVKKQKAQSEKIIIDNNNDKGSSKNKNIKSRVIDNIREQEKITLDEAKKDINLTKQKDENLKIGVMLPLSGENKDIGTLILNAIELALFQSRNSKIELIIRDTEGKPDKAIASFRDILENKAAFIIGPLFSKTLAAIEDMVDTNIINIFALTNNQNLAKEGVWVFGIDPQKQTEMALKFASDSGHENLVALVPQNAYGLLLFEAISNFSEYHLINLKKIEFYENNISSQQKAAKSLAKGFDEYENYLNLIKKNDSNEEIEIAEKPFDSVFIAASGQTLAVLASELQYNNVDPKKVQYLGISSWEDDSILREPALDGGIFVATTKAFQKDVSTIYKRSFNKDMPDIAMIAYDILALLSANAKLKDNITISDFLNEEGYVGLRGLFRLNKNGTVERSFDIKSIKRKKFIVNEKAQTSWQQIDD